MKNNKKIAILTGDVNGIGAEITIKALNKLDLPKEQVVLISNSDVLNFYDTPHPNPLPQGARENYQIIEIPFDKNDIQPGKLTEKSGEFSFQCLKRACELAKEGKIDAIVTAPVSKEALHLAGHKFSGQTEVLEHFLAHDEQHAEMLFVANDFRVLLLTRHVALKDVKISKENLIKKVTDLNEIFKDKFKISAPKFALCALNPHAGEHGILGREEIEEMIPAVEALRKRGIDITNPLPADTLFINAAKNYLESQKPIHLFTYSPIHLFDCYLACYHDQGLIPIKTVAADKTVNMTIGLDVIRTSPSHGTAFDIAGKNIADENSMIEAIKEGCRFGGLEV